MLVIKEAYERRRFSNVPEIIKFISLGKYIVTVEVSSGELRVTSTNAAAGKYKFEVIGSELIFKFDGGKFQVTDKSIDLSKSYYIAENGAVFITTKKGVQFYINAPRE